MSKREILFPVTDLGGLAYFAIPGRATVGWGRNEQKIAWVPKCVFNRQLTFESSFKGRSAACFEFKDANGAEYTMGMKGLTDTLLLGRFDGKVARGPWTFAKLGTSYLIVPVDA